MSSSKSGLVFRRADTSSDPDKTDSDNTKALRLPRLWEKTRQRDCPSLRSQSFPSPSRRPFQGHIRRWQSMVNEW